MKTLFFAFLLTAPCWAEEKPMLLTSGEMAGLKTYDLQEVTPALDGKVVRVKFNSREDDITKKDAGLTGSLRHFKSLPRIVGAQQKNGSLEVIIPTPGMKWFARIPLDKTARGSMSVVARIKVDGRGEAYGELLGREIRQGMKGAEIVW